MKRKLLAYFLVIAMLLAMLPVQTFAAEAELLESGSVTLKTASEGEYYIYEWTATSSGTVTLSMGAADPGWSYMFYINDVAQTALKPGNTAATVEFTVSAGDLVAIEFGAYDKAGWTQGDGTISYSISFLASEDSSDTEVEKEAYVVSDTVLQLGDNALTLDTGAVTTIYAFSPNEIGVYTFTADDASALVGDWGPGSYLISDKTAEKTSTLEWTCTAVGQTIMVGISGVETVTLTVEKTADYIPVTIEYTVYENTEFDDWADYVIDNTTFKAISVTDSVADVIVKCEDGLYRYGSETGRVVVANLNNNVWMSFGAILENGNIRVAFEDENGEYTTGLDMTDAIKQYNDAGRYPLTDELIYMLKLVGEDRGWYDINTTDGFYLFGTKTVDPETAYLAFCGTVCEHTWVDADCENAKTCSACGKTDGEALGHVDEDVDNFCDNCGNCVQHTYNDGFYEAVDDGHCSVCDNCGVYDPESFAEHVDEDSDYYCDVCYTNICAHGDVTLKSDMTEHWWSCNLCYGLVDGFYPHSDGEDEDTLCDVCGFETSTITVYFDNTAAQWETIRCYWSTEDDGDMFFAQEISADGDVYAFAIPVNAPYVAFRNYLPGQPESTVPGGYQSITAAAEANKTYAYTTTCTVTYAGHGTDWVEDVTVAANTVITLPCRSDGLVNDRVFMGFNTEADGSGETYMDCTEYTVTGDVTLYAQWADIAVGDAFLNNGEYVDNNGNVTTIQPEGGYAHFENGTLTLNNFTYTGEGYLFNHNPYYNSTATSAVYYGMSDLNVVLEGENVLVNTTEYGCGLRTVQNLTISGSGSLTAEAHTVVFSGMAITVDSGILNLTASREGISASSSLTVNNGEITIVSDWYGLQAGINDTSGGINIHGGTLNISGRNLVVTCGGALNVTGGSLTVNADEDLTAVITYGGINLENVELLKPVNGGVKSYESEYVIVDADGYNASAVVIGEPVEDSSDSVKFQAKNDGTAIRLLSYVGDLSAYASVTFNVTIDGKNTDLTCTKAYTSVLANGDTVKASDVFGEDAAYFVMFTMDKITEDYYAKDMTITVTWTSVDGTETVSESRTVNVGDLVG